MAEREVKKWITINGKHIPIYNEDGEWNSPVKKVSDEEKEALKAKLKETKKKRKEFLLENRELFEGGELYEDSKEVRQYKKLTEQMEEAQYEAHKVMPPVILDESKWNSEISALSREEASIARRDLLENKDLYVAIQMASAGTSYGTDTKDTEVDALYKKHPDLYDVFADTRETLKKRYGDTITLYRAGTKATEKATVNMASTKKNAEQYSQWYGSKVTSSKVPIDDILAVNIDRTGDYEEFIILNR